MVDILRCWWEEKKKKNPEKMAMSDPFHLEGTGNAHTSSPSDTDFNSALSLSSHLRPSRSMSGLQLPLVSIPCDTKFTEPFITWNGHSALRESGTRNELRPNKYDQPVYGSSGCSLTVGIQNPASARSWHRAPSGHRIRLRKIVTFAK